MEELYSLAAKVSLDVTAFSTAAQLAMGLFQKLEGAAGKTERAVQTALAGRTTAYAAAERASNSLNSAQVRFAAAEANANKVMGSSNATIAQQIAAQDRLSIAHNTLANAQLSQATAANRAANAMATYNTASAEAVGLAERQATLARGMGLLVGGAAVTGIGVGLFAFMDSAVKKAMDLQTIMVGLQQRTGMPLIDPTTQGFTAQGTGLQNLFTTIGLTNQMSTTDVAGVAQAASLAGITTMSQLKGMLKPLANYAEVMLRATGASTSGSAKVATEFAHLFGAFGTKQIGGVSDTQYLVNQLGKAMQIVPVSQEQFLQMVSQYAGTVRPMYRGKPPGQFISDTIDYGVLLAQMGQNTSGGSNLARLIVQAMGAGSRTSKIGLADLATIQRVSGVSFTNKQGQITDPVSLMKALTGFATAKGVTPQEELIYFQQAFKQAGTKLAGLFADPVVAQRYKVIAAGMKTMPDVAAQQRAYNASPAGQFNQARKNFNSAMTQLGILWLPIATRAANALAAFTRGVVEFTQKHPQLMQFLAIFIALSAAVALVVGPLLMLAGIFSLLSLVGLPALLDAIWPITLGFVVLTAAIAAIAIVITNWGSLMASDRWGVLRGEMDLLWHSLTLSNKAFTLLDTAVLHALDAFTPLTATVQWLVDHIPTYHPAFAVPSLGKTNVGSFLGMELHNWLPFLPTGGGGYVPPAMAPRGQSAAGEHHYHFGGVTVAPVVHAAPGHDEETLAKHVVTLTMRELGDGLQAAIDGGATAVFGLSPSLHVMR